MGFDEEYVGGLVEVLFDDPGSSSGELSVDVAVEVLLGLEIALVDWLY